MKTLFQKRKLLMAIVLGFLAVPASHLFWHATPRVVAPNHGLAGVSCNAIATPVLQTLQLFAK